MHGAISGPVTEEQRAVLDDVHRRYDMTSHTQTGSGQADALTDAFVDRAAIVGPPEVCIARLEEIAASGIDKVTVIGPSIGADPEQARLAARLFVDEVLPAFKAADGR
jgi:alkanesulfonate monooxygenase SsuD/methylene tetrahydromethanopterin reductase-like flavin-dependent oxidoreductase (luciferase family)